MYFIGIARGALAELETQLQLVVMPGFIVADRAAFERADRVGKLPTGLHKRLNTP
ncbi:MAG: hypothetical protein EPO60_05100 [Rugosibacter sp.]|nr:MAG: hypothetical protein EPO60_05100 [Rugosibacter sp.]TBR13126.1 MAG: hypothetical protein EPO43_11720 [Rugosibacter sp.]